MQPPYRYVYGYVSNSISSAQWLLDLTVSPEARLPSQDRINGSRWVFRPGFASLYLHPSTRRALGRSFSWPHVQVGTLYYVPRPTGMFCRDRCRTVVVLAAPSSEVISKNGRRLAHILTATLGHGGGRVYLPLAPHWLFWIFKVGGPPCPHATNENSGKYTISVLFSFFASSFEFFFWGPCSQSQPRTDQGPSLRIPQ